MSTARIRHPSRLYKVVVVSLFLCLMGIVMGIASPGISDTDLDVVANQVHVPVILTTSLLYLFVLARLVINRRRILWAGSRLVSLFPLILYCIASAAWSTDADLTLRRAAFLVLTTIIGLILGADFELPELGRLLAAACLIHIALCAIFFLMAPSLLYSPSDIHSLKGLTTHKNIFGFEQGLAVLSFLLVPFDGFRRLRLPLTMIAGLLLFLSRSSGALVAIICALSLLPLLFIAHFRGIHKVPILMVTIGIVAGVSILLFRNAAAVPQLFSKDATLTGRTELWSLLFIAIGHHPWFGYGFDAFWKGLQGDSLTIIRGVGWLVPTAHNGYLDLLLGTGYLGAILFVPPLLQTISNSFRYLTIEGTTTKFFPITFIVFWLVYNLNESALITRSGIPFLLFVSLSTALSARIADDKAERGIVRSYSIRPELYHPPSGFLPNQL